MLNSLIEFYPKIIIGSFPSQIEFEDHGCFFVQLSLSCFQGGVQWPGEKRGSEIDIMRRPDIEDIQCREGNSIGPISPLPIRNFLMLALVDSAIKASWAMKDGAVVKIDKKGKPPLKKYFKYKIKRMLKDLKNTDLEPVETRTKGKSETGTIAVDAIFTPVRKVSYRVESMRVGERTDFDRLILELETDGTISPEGALSQASEILVKHFSLIQETFKETVKPPAESVKKIKAKKSPAKKHAEKKKKKKTK